MTDSLRDRIAAVIYNTSDEYARKLMVRPDCPGASEVEGSGKPVCYVLADAVIRELEAGYVLVPKNVTLVQWADEAFQGQTEGKFKHERISEWEPDERL